MVERWGEREIPVIVTGQELEHARAVETAFELDRMKATIEFLWAKSQRCYELLMGPAPEMSIPTVRTLLSQMMKDEE